MKQDNYQRLKLVPNNNDCINQQIIIPKMELVNKNTNNWFLNLQTILKTITSITA